MAHRRERRDSPRITRATLRATHMDGDLRRLGTYRVVDASSSGLLLDAAGAPSSLAVGDELSGMLWDAERAGTVPFRGRCVRDAGGGRMGLHLFWIEPRSYDVFQELVYGEPAAAGYSSSRTFRRSTSPSPD